MGQAFYRKYRSKTFEEVIGQSHVTSTLQNALKAGRISHAYLFTGPKGVGKTSVARILAHAVNDLPYHDDSMHLDIIEIDAASNRRIDEIRDLKEKVHTAPTSAKYKVYIIDEVHMLTREAFNALLKTLEEPPAHCIFILATTEAHKLPETIVSRTQRFNFKPVGGDSASEHIKDIARKEKIAIEPEAINLIVQHGDGSFRDSIGLLDQLSSLNQTISAESARQFLGLPSDEAVASLFEAISNGNSTKVLEILISLKELGTSAPKIAESLSSMLRARLIQGDSRLWLTILLRQLLLVPSSPSPYDQLEISVLEAAANSPPMNIEDTTDKKTTRSVNLSAQPTILKDTKQDGLVKNRKLEQKIENFNLLMWPQVIDIVKSQAASIYTALRLAQPSLNDTTLTLSFQFPLHQKKLSQANNLEVIGRVIEDLSGAKLSIRCVVDRNIILSSHASKTVLENYDETNKNANKTPIKAISNIFGGAEVLES